MSFTPFLMTLLNFVFGQQRLWKFLHGLVAVPVETVRFERSIHLFDCNTSWVNLNIVSLFKPVSLSKIKVLCCVNVDELCYSLRKNWGPVWESTFSCSFARCALSFARFRL